MCCSTPWQHVGVSRRASCCSRRDEMCLRSQELKPTNSACLWGAAVAGSSIQAVWWEVSMGSTRHVGGAGKPRQPPCAHSTLLGAAQPHCGGPPCSRLSSSL